jgi:hypothetical protein
MKVTWSDDNSFEFTLADEFGAATGIVHKAGVDVDNTDLVYDYAPPPTGPGPVVTDGGLNKLAPPATAAPDVNHLDLCLEAVDTEAPVVVIDEPQQLDPPKQVSGTETVTATVKDNAGISSVTASVSLNGSDPLYSVDLGEPTSVVGDPTSIDGAVYTWTWDMTVKVPEDPNDPNNDTLIPLFPIGFYTIEVTALDTALPEPLEGSDSVTVEVVESAESCVGLAGDEDEFPSQPGDSYEGGCQPTVVNIQLPPDNNFVEGPQGCDSLNLALNGEKCRVTGDLLKPDLDGNTCPACSYCPADTFPDPRLVCLLDNGNSCTLPEDFLNGRWVPNLDPALGIRDLVVFAELGLDPDGPQFAPDALVLNQYTFGNPCIVIANHRRNFPLKFAYPEWPNEGAEATGLIVYKTHFFEEEGLLPDEFVPKCYGAGPDQTLDLQEASQGGYQTTNKSLMYLSTAAVRTDRCFNPPRNASRDKSFDISGIKETAGLPFDVTDPAARSAILDFKYDMAGLSFDALFAYIDVAAAAVDETGSPCLIRGKISDLTKFANQARAQFDKRNDAALSRAIEDLTSLANVMRTRQDWCIIEDNPPGAVLAEDLGLIWRIKQIREELGRIEAL